MFVQVSRDSSDIRGGADRDRRGRCRWVVDLVALLLMATGCSGNSSPAEAPRSSSTSTVVSTEPAHACPNPHGGICLGRLDAGEYSTAEFQPTLTYSVPAGWDNEEDLPGNFLLLPPGEDLAGVDAGTSDYIGVYIGVKASGGCDGLPDAGLTPQQIAAVIRQDPDLEVTQPRQTEVGGLRGLVMDIELSQKLSKDCPSFGEVGHAVPLILGVPPSSLDHAIVDGLTMRLYLLAHDGGSLAIEVDDVHKGQNLTDYSELIRHFHFGG
jgi:hypothetical protein